MAEYQLDFTNSPEESCAVLFAILAFPEDDEHDEKRMNLHASLCHLYYRSRAEKDEIWATTPQLLKPLYAFRDQKQIGRDLKQFKRRLRDRMQAAKIAIAFLQEVELGPAFELPKNVKRMSIKQLSEMLYEETGHMEIENIANRIWHASLPVIHLAAATAVVMDQLEKSNLAQPNIGHFLTNPDLARHVVETSNLYADMLAKSTKLSMKPETLIRLYPH
jgi:hypothetical protein